MSQSQKSVSKIAVIVAFATVYIVWGSTYFAIQIAVREFPPFLLGGMRFIAAGLIMMLYCLITREKLFDKKIIFHAAIGGILMLFLGNGAVIWVEQSLPSGLVAVIVSSSPIWFVLLDWPLWAQNFKSKATIVGLITGFTGVILLFCERLINSDTVSVPITTSSIIFLLVASVSWTAGSLYSKYKSSKGSAVVNTAWQMFIAGLAFIPGALIRNEFREIDWHAVPANAWFAASYLVTMGSIAGFSAYVWLLRVRPATQVSTYGYVNPVVAVILGVFLANESISHIQLTGLAIILGSVLLINLHKYRKAAV